MTTKHTKRTNQLQQFGQWKHPNNQNKMSRIETPLVCKVPCCDITFRFRLKTGILRKPECGLA